MKVTRSGNCLVLAGEFTQDGARACEAPLQALLEELGAGDEPLVLDFTAVPYMDSAGFSRWIVLERRARKGGRELRVRSAPPLIRDLFRFADLEEVLEP